MHFDLAHALVSGVAILATLWAIRQFGIVKEDESLRWNWKVFVAIFVVIFVINIVWPSGGP